MNNEPTSSKEQFELAEQYRYGRGVPGDMNKAFIWYSKAAEQGYSFAQEVLGDFYKYGWTTISDKTKADYWYNKAIDQYLVASEQGEAQAQYRLGHMYIFGQAQLAMDKRKAQNWIVKAASQDHAEAQWMLGCNYKVGATLFDLGIPDSDKDNKVAVSWFMKSAENGFSAGQEDLGDCYASGSGVKKDPENANFWYTKAAEQGSNDSQYKLGINYYYGNGLPKDTEKAKHWIAQAAGQGHEKAQEALKLLNAGKVPKKVKTGGCYIATCIYGSYDSPELLTLRYYRDSRLSNSSFGRLFIRIYYVISPGIVELFGRKKWFHALFKPVLNRIVHRLKNK